MLPRVPVSGAMLMPHRKYVATETLGRFHDCDDFVRGIRGPVGSGKSTASCWEIWRRANEQEPNAEGVRSTRWAIVRNTYRELKDTTLKTWLYWFREDDLGAFRYGDMVHNIQLGLKDGTKLETEVMFRALDRPGDIAKLLSLEITGAWVNEARELPKGVIDTLTDRVGRYPPQQDGGPTWRGIIMDTNAPDDDHWWYRLAEGLDLKSGQYVGVPEGWSFFTQPPGLLEIDGEWETNPAAENIVNLERDYYLTRCPGKTRDYILVYYCNQYGFVQDGKAVYPEYQDHVHCTEDAFDPIPGLTIYVGIDFGLTPAAVFGQRTVTGQWRWFDELVTEDMGAVRFAEVLGPMMRHKYSGFEFEIYADPAGDDRAQTDERTPIQILQKHGIPAIAAPSNDPVVRREAVASALMRMADGQPGLVVSPRCRIVRKGMAGGYVYRRIQIVGEERYQDKPNKNRFSHPCEAAQYMMLGAGEGVSLIMTPAHLHRKLPKPDLRWIT